MDEELEKRIFPNRRFDHLTLEGQKLENKRMGLIGLLSFFTILYFEPCMSHIVRVIPLNLIPFEPSERQITVRP